MRFEPSGQVPFYHPRPSYRHRRLYALGNLLVICLACSTERLKLDATTGENNFWLYGAKRLLFWTLVCSVVWTSARVVLLCFARFSPVAHRGLFQHVLAEGTMAENLTIAVAVFFLISLLNDLLDRRLNQTTGSLVWLSLPMFLTAVLFQTESVFALGLCLTTVLFILRKIYDAHPSLAGSDTGESARPIRKITVLGSVLFLLAAPVFAAVFSRPSVFLYWLAVYLLAFLATGLRWRRWLNRELFLVGLTCLAAISWLPLMALKKAGPQYAVIAPLLALVSLHLYACWRNRARIRGYNILMLAMVVLGVALLDYSLAPLNLAARFNPETQRRPDNIVPLKAIIGVMPGEMYDRQNYGWFVEAGRVRGDDPPLPKPPGQTYILALGSSSTMGFGIENDSDVWPAKLERLLKEEEDNERFWVTNGGTAGSTSFAMLINFKNVMIRYDPDVLLLYIGYNDTVHYYGPFTEREMFAAATQKHPVGEIGEVSQRLVEESQKQFGRASDTIIKLQKTLGRSTLYRLLRFHLLPLGALAGGSDLVPYKTQAVPPWDFEANLREFAEICKRRGIDLVVVGEASRTDLSEYKAIMADAAEKYGFIYLDADSKLRECGDRADLFQDEVHLTVEGNRCLARIVYNLLLQKRIVEKENP